MKRVAVDMQATVGRKTGIGIYATQLLAALRRLAPGLDLVELTWGRDLPMRLDRRLRWQQVEVPRRARQSQAALLHIPGFDAPGWKPCPVVLTVHDLIGMLFPQNLPLAARFYWSRWLPWSVRWADAVIADSEQTRRDLVRLLRVPEERITVIPLGVEPVYRPQTDRAALERLRQRYALPPRFILYLGTLEPRKGLDTLLTAYAALTADWPHALVLAGKKGWYTDTLFTQVKQQGLEERVHFTDYIPDEELPGLYNLAEVFAFPSRYEGFGLPPLEAMACGVPVVSSNAASLPEVIGDAGLLVPPDDPGALAAALRRVLSDADLRADLQARGWRQAARFTWDETARRTLAFYRRVLHEPLP